MKKINYLLFFVFSSLAISSVAMEQEAVDVYGDSLQGQTSDEGEDWSSGDEQAEDQDNRWFLSRLLFRAPAPEAPLAPNNNNVENNVEQPAAPSVLETLLRERLDKRNISPLAWEIIQATETEQLNTYAAELQEEIRTTDAGPELEDLKRKWNLYRYERLADALVALTNALRQQVIDHGDAALPNNPMELEAIKHENSPRSYQYQLRGAFVAVMFALEEFETQLGIEYRDTDPYPGAKALDRLRGWGDKLYGKLRGYSDQDYLKYTSKGRISKAELARRYHLARNGMASMSDAWTRATGTWSLKTGRAMVYSVKGIATALMAPRQAALAASEQFSTLTAWFGAQNPKSVLNMSLKTMRAGKKLTDGFGIVEFARKHPLIAKNLVANLNLFYQTLSVDRSTVWSEVLGDFEGVCQAREVENVVNDFLLGSEEYLESSADILDAPLSPEMLVVCQIAESLPYLAGAYIGLTVKTGLTGWVKTLVKLIPGYGPVASTLAGLTGRAVDAGVGIAIVHMKKKAAEKISRNLEITMNTVRRVIRSYMQGNTDLKELAKEAAVYVGIREAIRQYGTLSKLAGEKRCGKECGIRTASVYVYDSEVEPLMNSSSRVKNVLMRLTPGIITGACGVLGKFGLGTLAQYYIEADPDFSLLWHDSVPWLTMVAAGIVLPPVVYLARHGIDWCSGGRWAKARADSRRLRQLVHQKSRLPVVCEQSSDLNLQNMAPRFEEAIKRLSDDELIEIAKSDLDVSELHDKLTERLIQLLEDDQLTDAVQAELAKSNPEFEALITQINLLKEPMGIAEYRVAVKLAVKLFVKGRDHDILDQWEKNIIASLQELLDAKVDERLAKIDSVLGEINKLRIRQLKDGLREQELARREAAREAQRRTDEVAIEMGGPNDNNAPSRPNERTPLTRELHEF